MRRLQHLIEHGGNLFDAYVNTLPHMTSRMHVVKLTGRCFHALQVIGKNLMSKLAGLGLIRRRIERIGRMRQEHGYAVFRRQGLELCNVRWINGFRLAAARIAREKLEGTRVDGCRLFRHGSIPL